VIASLVGTYRVLEPQDAQQINSFIIYKFRGDPALFDAGLADISRRTGWTSFGVVPWLSEVSKLIFSELQARGVKVTIITNSLAAKTMQQSTGVTQNQRPLGDRDLLQDLCE